MNVKKQLQPKIRRIMTSMRLLLVQQVTQKQFDKGLIVQKLDLNERMYLDYLIVVNSSNS